MSDILNALNWRYAVKEYDPSKKINDKDLQELIEVIRLAPSSFGLQPWKFIIVDNKQLRNKIKEKAWNQPQVTDASNIIVFCARTDITEDYIKEYIKDMANTRNISAESLKDYENMMIGFRKNHSDESIKEWTKRQTYIPLGMLLQAAAIKKIDATPMEGFSSKDVDEILDLKSKGLTSVAICALGFRSQGDKTMHYKKVRYDHSKIIDRI